jgi:hypothetical protein
MGLRQKKEGAGEKTRRQATNTPNRAKKSRRKAANKEKPVITTQIAYVDIVDSEGNLLKRAELEPDVRDYTGLMQIAHEDVEMDEFHLIPYLQRQKQLERKLFKMAKGVRGKMTPIYYPKRT